MAVAGGRGRLDTEGPAARIAPIQFTVGRPIAVARGVDHIGLAARHPRNRFAITDFLSGGEEVRDVEAEAPGVRDADLIEPVGDLVGGQPARVPGVDVHGGGGVAGQGVDAVADQVEALLASTTRQAVGHVERVGFENDRHRSAANLGGDAVDPPAVGVGRAEPARREASAVAVRQGVDGQHRQGTGGPGTVEIRADRGGRNQVVDEVRLRGVGDVGQLGIVGVGARGAHGRRVRIDVEGRSADLCGIVSQAYLPGLRWSGGQNQAGDDRSRHEGSDPPRDRTSS